MSEVDIRKPQEIIADFSATVRSLIGKLEKKSRDEIELANLDRLKKRISLLRSTLGESALITESTPFFLEYSDKIINRDENFFISMDVKSEYIKRKGRIDKQDEFIFTMTDSIRSHYNRSSQIEKDEVYNNVKKLLSCCAEYKIATM